MNLGFFSIFEKDLYIYIYITCIGGICMKKKKTLAV